MKKEYNKEKQTTKKYIESDNIFERQSEKRLKDQSILYSKRLYEEIATSRTDSHDYENPLKMQTEYNCLYCADSQNLSMIKNNVITLIITSPPYNVGKDYDADLTLEEYMSFLNNVWKECKRVLRPGGRLCINIAGVGRRPYIPMQAYITINLIKLGFLMRGEIIWDKGQSVGTSTAWGSWRSPTNPTLRDIHEYILIFSKERFKVNKNQTQPDITSEEFTESTKSIWSFPTESSNKVQHPAPFPLELPIRLIKLYSFPNDIVLDPFVGSGTTCLAAKILNRNWIGVDNNKDYIQIAEKRIDPPQQHLFTL